MSQIHLSQPLYKEINGYSIQDLWEIVVEIADFAKSGQVCFHSAKTSFEFIDLVNDLRRSSPKELANFTSSICLQIKKMEEVNNG